ncbi:hypothetical protein MSTO_27210 [Mycobacterium stomatepiae]|uniref:Uncharacterized protein n=1 Tax=Mycobacterium stomatepiae TaxID=470076 RepID=A0A7I7Q915_9MYCO|nr:hypothetical protein MSTO_27210 [Mycobacterium stomatepiae]
MAPILALINPLTVINAVRVGSVARSRGRVAGRYAVGKRAGPALAPILGEQQDGVLAERRQSRHFPLDAAGELLQFGCGVVVGGDPENQLVAIAQHRDSAGQLRRRRRDR